MCVSVCVRMCAFVVSESIRWCLFFFPSVLYCTDEMLISDTIPPQVFLAYEPLMRKEVAIKVLKHSENSLRTIRHEVWSVLYVRSVWFLCT